MSQIKPIRPIPIKLEREPLIDAVFEMRFDAFAPVASILPGMLYGSLDGEKTIEHLPIMNIPKEVRSSDDNLRFAPLVRIGWGGFWIFIGDNTFAVSSKLPYKGWEYFKGAIAHTFKYVFECGFIDKINRYSTKYVNIISDDAKLPFREAFNFDLHIGGFSTGFSDCHIRAGLRISEVVHIINLVSDATTQLRGQPAPLKGSVIDIDSYHNLSGERPDIFLSKLPERAEAIHSDNKTLFFNCLSEKTIDWLVPTYE